MPLSEKVQAIIIQKNKLLLKIQSIFSVLLYLSAGNIFCISAANTKGRRK
jgi:hypothetical protein